MKKQWANKLRLGLFVIIGMLLLTVVIFYIGQKQRLFTSTFRLRTIYKNVNGLQVGNNVRFAGINVGNVENIQIITDTTVQVDILIDKKVKRYIKKDAQAAIGSEGLMGDKIVVLSPGTAGGRDVENNDYIKATEGNNIDIILEHVKVASENAASITGDLADIISNIKAGHGSIGKLLMDTSVAKNLDQSIANVKQGTQGFKDNMDAAKHNILLRGYFKKKEKEAEEKKEDAEKK